MKHRGPLNGGGPRSEKKMRVAAERSHTRSDTGRASPTSRSTPSLSKRTASATALTVLLTARGRSRFDVSFGETQIVTKSGNPISDAARVLHGRGFADDRLLIARHAGADHHAISGQLGDWRKVRIREGALRTAAGIPDVRTHNLRHSYASVPASAGFSLAVIGALLGHTTRHPRSIARMNFPTVRLGNQNFINIPKARHQIADRTKKRNPRRQGAAS